jgi:hypothetical protein
MTGTWDDDSEQKSEVPEYSAARGEPNSELMQTDHDVVKEIANTGPLDKETLDSIGLNAELLQIFVQRFANITLDDDRDDKDKKWVKMLASERLERAELINNISKSILVANACETRELTTSYLIYFRFGVLDLIVFVVTFCWSQMAMFVVI